jgi:acyl carrier protein
LVSRELRERLAGLIEERFGTSRELLLADTQFKELGFDSLLVLEIGFFLEEEFRIDFGGKVTAQSLPRHLSDLATLVQAQLPRRTEDESVGGGRASGA